MIRASRALPALAVAAAVPVVALLAACSGSTHSPSAATSGERPTGASSLVATRWWSDGAGGLGSTVSPSDASTRSLTPSRDVYCTMLRQTMAAGKSVLPGATATSPALASATQAFVTELLGVAPPAVAGSWRVLGPVLVDVVKSGGALADLRAHVDANAVSAAAKTVSDDALAGCHLQLAR